MALRNAFGEIALDDTVQSLKDVSDNILIAIEVLDAAVDALSAKTIKSDTDHVSVSNFPSTQAVTIDATSLAALETVSVSNFPATQPVSGTVAVSNMVGQGLTDTQLRASDVKVTLDGEQVAISNFPATQAVSGPITNEELRASAVPVSLDSSGISSTDLQLEILNMLRLIKTTLTRLPFYDPSNNRAKMTTVIESGTITTCGTVTGMTNVGSYPWDAMVRMQNRSSWANTCGGRIS